MAENTSWVPEGDARRLSDELHHWFKDRAEQEARLVAPKAIEYGSRSMITQGRGLAELGGVTEINDQDAFELAVWDMVRLKLGRWTEAVMHGKPVSDDTLLDIGIYVKMAQRNREAGSWPGVRAAEPGKIITQFNIVDGIPRVIPTAETTQKLEDDDHHVHQINDAWRLQYRGEIAVLKAYQWDLVRNADNYTQHQFVQARNPVGGFHYVTSNPSPECTGYHAHDGYCLRPIPDGVTAWAKLPETRKEETK